MQTREQQQSLKSFDYQTEGTIQPSLLPPAPLLISVYIYIYISSHTYTHAQTTLHTAYIAESAHSIYVGTHVRTMASSIARSLVVLLIVCAAAASSVNGQLSPTFYARSCPNLQSIVQNAMRQAVNTERRIGASILRLFFHDCFVQVR